MESESTVMTQWGSEAVPFSAYSGEDLDAYLAGLADFLRELDRIDPRYRVFVTYGSLLGAVREAGLIPNDFDFDVCVFDTTGSTTGETLDSFFQWVKRVVTLEGVGGVTPVSSTYYALRCQFGELTFAVDLFLGWIDEASFLQSFTIDHRFGLTLEDILPLGQVQLHGRDFPSPRRPDRILTAMYGPDWRVPNPDFNYKEYLESLGGRHPQSETIFGALNQGVDYWNEAYAASLAAEEIEAPSQFAVFSEAFIPRGGRILELGTGSGRDFAYFVDRGFNVVGSDYCVAAKALTEHMAAAPRGMDQQLGFVILDYADRFAVDSFAGRETAGFDCVYARFLLHAVTETAQTNIIRLVPRVLKETGVFCAEFRTAGFSEFDKRHAGDEWEITGTHYRRPIHPPELLDQLASVGFEQAYAITGQGFAYHHTGDPVVTRLIAARREA